MTVQKLNQHPLNEAALKRLRRESESPLLGLMHLLTLAHLGLVGDDGEPVDPFSPEGKALRDWSAGKNLQTAAMENLEDALSPEEIATQPLPRLARTIVETLLAAQCRADEP